MVISLYEADNGIVCIPEICNPRIAQGQAEFGPR